MHGQDTHPHSAENARLRSEVKARVAEVSWVKAHYRQHLKEALAALNSLQASAMDNSKTPEPRTSHGSSVESEQILQLKSEIERLKLGERRYLDRIAELKDLLAAKRTAKGKTL